MASSAAIFSLLYWLCSFLFVLSPAEFKSAGLTAENILSSWVGTEDNDFVNYHIRRISATIILQCAIPIGYFLGMTFVPDSGVTMNDMFSVSMELGWHIYSSVSLLILLAALTIIFYWQINDWSSHPLVKELEPYVNPDGISSSAWRICASEIGNEFRRIDKYATSPVGWSRIISTQNWIIVTSQYSVKIARQDKVTVAVMQSEEHDISPESNALIQFLHVRIKPTIRQDLKPFTVRILSTEYKELRDSIQSQIVTLPNVSIMQSVDELFLRAFREQVSENVMYEYTDRPDNCMGCMQVPAEVKLVKNCDTEGPNQCGNCLCRPMWCLDCLGRWYASRQDRNRTDTWLSSTATCPMCRTKFCMLDISKIA